MKERILKLAKRLNKFTLDEIALISEIEEKRLEVILENIEEVKKSGTIYLYASKRFKKKKRTNSILRYEQHSKETIDLVIKAFCADIKSIQTSHILNISRDSIHNFNNDFRVLIYNKQKKELLSNFEKTNKISSPRDFFDTEVYFYFYNKKLYVSDMKLKANELKNYTKEEMQELKKLYSRARRKIVNNCIYRTNYHYHIAEKIWRDSKSYDSLLEELYQLLNL